jgi:hypothetical protein
MSDMEGSFGMGDVFPNALGQRRGPYGTNLGDIWSGEDSEVGKMLMEREGLVMIHEVLEKDGKIEERIYNVDQDNPDPEMQDLIKSAREGTKLWVAAQAMMN